MALSVTPQASPLGAQLVEETSANATARNNVTGAGGLLYMIDIDNPNATVIYLKLYDNAAPVIGTTAADWVFKIAATTRRAIGIPTGLAFSALSFACVNWRGSSIGELACLGCARSAPDELSYARSHAAPSRCALIFM